uniref:uncharacterized protein LOC120344525 n=1 Tax=Styela clava TaxID=7725 RepID=UPI00193A8A04|nr:uncharacterized protein LOC120344525 [Styela clava]
MNQIVLLVFVAILPVVLCQDDGMFLCKRLDSNFKMVVPGSGRTQNNNNKNRNNINKDRVTRVNGNGRPKPGPNISKGRPKPSPVESLDDKIEERLKALEDRIEFLESITEVSDRKDDVPAKLQTFCHVEYNNRCFMFTKKDRGMIDEREARNNCKKMGGRLADIYDESHLEKLEAYLRESMTEEIEFVYFIVGMTYRKQGNGVNKSDGTRSRFVKWYSTRFPSPASGNSQIQIQVNRDVEMESGMFNTSPFSKAKSALCEKSLESPPR